MLVSQIKIRQGKEHIQLSHLFSSAFVPGLTEVEQVLHNAKDMPELLDELVLARAEGAFKKAIKLYQKVEHSE